MIKSNLNEWLDEEIVDKQTTESRSQDIQSQLLGAFRESSEIIPWM